MDDVQLERNDPRAIVALLIELYVEAMHRLDGMEFVERVIAGDVKYALQLDTDEDEARVECAALRLMEAVEQRRTQRK